jgi:hypothetical protein
MDTIRFLETLGRNPAVIGTALQAYPEAVEALAVSEAEKMALRDRDHVALGRLLDGRAGILCLINTPDDGHENEAVPGDGDKDDDGIPDELDPASPKE